jgi:N-acetylglutamate synthase-like GNAT family acetyltransferase
MDQLIVRQIVFGSDDYRAALRLRYKVLREPLGLELGPQDTDSDETELQIGAFIASRLIGFLMMRVISPDVVQMRQVAVDPTIQKRGTGRALVEEFEARARALGAREIIMNARLTAQTFYEKLGYETCSTPYTQSTISHIKMKKSLASSPS